MGKKIIIIVIVLILPLFGIATNADNNKVEKPNFIRLIKKEGIKSFWMPPFIVRKVLSGDNNTQELVGLFDGCRSIRFAYLDKDKNPKHINYSYLFERLELNGYQTIMQIVEGNSIISIMTLIEKNSIRELIIYINDGSDILAISMKGKMDSRKLVKSLISLSN